VRNFSSQRGEHLGEEDAQFETSGKGRQRLSVGCSRYAKPFEDLGRPGLEAVAVEADDQVLDLGVALAVEFPSRLEDAVFLGQRFRQLTVAPHGHVDDGSVLVQKMVLLEHSESKTFRHRHRAGARLLPAGDNPQEGRFAGTVGAHQPVTAAGVELQAHLIEQRLAAVGFLEIGKTNHGEEG